MTDGGNRDSLITLICAVLAAVAGAFRYFVGRYFDLQEKKEELRHSGSVHHKRKKESKSAD